MFGKEILKQRTRLVAVEVSQNNPDIDLILKDICMSGMGGYESIHHIREFNKNVVIIAQIAYSLFGQQEKAVKAGCDD